MNLYVLKPEIGQSANGIIVEPLNQLLLLLLLKIQFLHFYL